MRLFHLLLLAVYATTEAFEYTDKSQWDGAAGSSGELELEYGQTALLFPSPVLRTRLDEYLAPGESEDAVASDLSDAVLRAFANFKAGIPAGESEGPTEENDMFYSAQNEQNHRGDEDAWQRSAASRKVHAAFATASEAYLRSLGFRQLADGRELNITTEGLNVWASIHSACSRHHHHVHPESVASGVYYVDMPAGAGRFVLTDPRGRVAPFEGIRKLTPRTGDLIIFPPWLQHEVAPSCGMDPQTRRVSISFNLIWRKPEGYETHWGGLTADYGARGDIKAPKVGAGAAAGKDEI